MDIVIFILSFILSWKDVEPKFESLAEHEILKLIEFSIEDIELMARVTMSEASTEPYECKQAVVQTMLNRYYSDKFPNTISEVIKGQFSTKLNGDPTEECYDAVIWGILHPNIFPTDMYWFRAEYHHDFANDYTQIGRTFFNTETDYHALDFD